MPVWNLDHIQTLYGDQYFDDAGLWWHKVRTYLDRIRRLRVIEATYRGERKNGMVTPRLLDIGQLILEKCSIGILPVYEKI